MRTEIGRAAWILACLLLGYAGTAAGQDAVSSSSTATVSMSLPLTPTGSAASGSVNDSSGGSLAPTDASGSSLSNMTVSTGVSVSSMGELSSGQGRVKSSASNGAASSFGVPSTGWGVGSSKTGDSTFQPGQSTKSGIAQWGLGSSTRGFGSQLGQATGSTVALSHGSKSGGKLAGRGSPTAPGAHYSVSTSSPGGNKMSTPDTSARRSAGHISSSSDSQERSQLHSANTDKSGAGSYTTDFPDSTRGTAVLSPPDHADQLFAFEPMLSTGFPDLADREFLVPSLRVEGPSSGLENKLDVYQRIEQRLRNDRNELQKKGMQQGKHGSGSASKNPFSSESNEKNRLEKKPSTFGPSY